MTKQRENGTRRKIKGKPCVYYDGYWIRHYDYDDGSLADKKRTIDKLTRRVFHHVEPGINTPGHRLEQIRESFDIEQDPAKKRVKGAMLAGALLNRGRDILTKLVELQDAGVEIGTDNELFNMCSEHFAEALELGKNIKLANGHEGLDELWGEPFKAFSLSPEDFYRSRYIKVAQTMSQIDTMHSVINNIIRLSPCLKAARPLINELCSSAKLACETLRTDPVIYEVWPRYIAAKEAFEQFSPIKINNGKKLNYKPGFRLIKEGADLMAQLSIVRVSMPRSVGEYIARCDNYIKEVETGGEDFMI